MNSKNLKFSILIVTLILLVTTIGPTRAGSSSLQDDPLRQGFAAAVSVGGGPIGPPFIIDDEIAGVETKDPAVAYNSQRQEYLVVWWNDRTGCDDIAGQRVSWNGAPIGAKIWIANGCPADRRYPDVAYNNQNDEYLVTWNEDDVDIRGQLLSGAGVITGGAFDIALSVNFTGLSATEGPTIGYAAIENKYLVVFDSNLWTGDSIVAQALNHDGSAWGTSFEVESLSSTMDMTMPELAYNLMGNEFLVVWAQTNPVQYDIRGRRVKMAGGAGNNGTAFWFSCDASRDDFAPAVATVPRSPSGQYLVAWQYSSPLSHLDLWAQRVDGGGTLEGSAFVVSNTTDWEEFPGVIGSNSNQQYLVTWTVLTTSSAHIFGRSIATNGSFLSDVTLVGGIYAYAADGVNGPAGDMLIAYEEIASGGYDLFGVLLGNRVYLPLLTK